MVLQASQKADQFEKTESKLLADCYRVKEQEEVKKTIFEVVEVLAEEKN